MGSRITDDRNKSAVPNKRVHTSMVDTRVCPGPISFQNQTSSNSTDMGSRITDDRNKSAVPNKRVRTSMVDTRVCPGPISFQNQTSSNSTDMGSRITDDRNKSAVPNKRVRTSMVDTRVCPGPISFQNQTSSNSTDMGSRITDDRNKSAVPNKRVRTSMVDTRVRGCLNNANLPRLSGMLDHERYFLKPRSSSLSQAEDKDRVLPPEKGNCEKLRMKGNHSGIKTDISSTSMINRHKDREHKLGVQHKSNNDSRARPSERPGFRPTMHEENQAASSTAIINGKISQKPRSSSATSAISSQCVVHPGTNRINFAPGLGNGKRSAQTISSSPSVAQWAGQRPVKTARIARRINLAPTAIQVDDRSFAEGFGYNDTSGGESAKPDSHAILGSDVAGRLSNCKPFSHGKVNTENLNSSTGLSERGHIEGGHKRKSMDKRKTNAVVEVTFKQADPSLATLVLSTNNSEVSSKEGNRDGIRRQGRSRRRSASAGIRVCKAGDKIDITSNTKQLRSMRMVFDKVKNKPSQPLTKKRSSDCKSFTRSRCTVNSVSSGLTGEMDDDREEIVAAAEAAINTRDVACSGPFWKQMEHYFAVPTKDDTDYLKQYVDFVCKTTPTSSSQPTCSSNKKLDNDALGLFGSLKKLPSLSEVVLSAFTTEDVTEQRTRIQDGGEQHGNFDYMSEVSPSGICNDIDCGSKGSSRRKSEMGAEMNRDNDRVNRCYACSTSSNAHQIYLSGVLFQNDETGLEGDVEDSELDALDERHPRVWQKNQDDLISGHQSDSTVSSIFTDAIEYKNMCLESLDSRILQELQHTLPEAVPDLALREDDEISEYLHKLQNELQQQEAKNKARIYNLEKAVLRKRQFEDREREHLAMNKLLERAFNRRIGRRGTNSSPKSSGSRVAKQAALSFAKRTLERCRNFDATGRSCFTEATLKEKLFCINSKETDIKSTADTTECKTLPANSNSGGARSSLDMKSLDVSTLASENSGHLVAQQIQKKDMESKEQSDSCQAATSSLEQTGRKDDSGSIRTRNKEVLLEDVVRSSDLRNSSVPGSSLIGRRKGKHGEREQEGKGKNKEIIARMNNAKSGRHCSRNVMGERETERKPRQRNAQLSKEVNGLPSKPTEGQNKCSSNFNENARDKSIKAKGEFKIGTSPGISQDVQCESEGAIDLWVGDQHHDLSTFWNFEEDILPDAAGDYNLEVPMDDLFDIRMI